MSRTIAVLGFLAALPVGAQVATPAPTLTPPQIITSATGEAPMTPDRATVMFAVETRAPSAAAAGAENARRQRAVLDTIRVLGYASGDVSTLGYSVVPEMRYDGKEPKVIGYVARNTILVEVRRVEQTGALIDAALKRGANVVSGLRFYSSRLDEARREALAAAVARARADADAMAKAAGGTLGALSELSSSGYRPMMNEQMAFVRAAAADTPTPIEPGEQRVTVTVSARWNFNPGR